MSIHILPPEVASQIAAGEVVERPASVVKELVENALDAGARTITVTVRDAGRTLVEVADDGAGIPSQEVARAVERHATSKLDSAEDLFHVVTLGFRGEALAAIGSVSRLTLTSRAADSPTGARVRVDGGAAGKVEQAGVPVGTVVRVEGLFYNVPARLKFLKQDNTERRQIDALVTRYALAYPEVRFKLSDGGSTALQTAGDGDRRTILATLYGVDVAKQILEVLAEEAGVSLTGFISPVSLTRSNRKDITFFVNGRWIQDTALTTALIQAYHTLLMVGRYPLAALFIQVPPEDVDVNVHPAKAEVRFRNPDRLFSLVQRSTRRALLAYSPVQQLAPTLWGSRAMDDRLQTDGVGLDWAMAQETQAGDSGALTMQRPGAETARGEPVVDRQSSLVNLPLLRLVGQIGATYLVAEGPDGLYLIDQHAAHERVLFEKLLRQRERKMLSSQALLSPQVVQLPPAQADLLQAQLGVLETFGFQVEPFGPNAFQVRAMPALFGGAEPAAALRALVEDFEEDETPLQSAVEAKIAGRVCKRLAVKAGMALSPEEQRALLTDLENCESPRTCPHGRPTMIHLSVDLLERQFGRRGSR
jgi:DNA mismatch repair protein MutL